MSIDTWCTEEIVCPFCGYVFDGSYEYIGDELVECNGCRKTFELVSEETIQYYTKKPDWLRQWRAYNERRISEGIFRREREANTVKVTFK